MAYMKEHFMWFEKLTGFKESSPESVRQNISVDGEVLTSHVNGRSWFCGTLETPTLGELRKRVEESAFPEGVISLKEVVADVRQLHFSPSNSGALFQVASQFNLLEMISPDVTPEQGVDRYENDRTQGPMCAMAAGAGTIYRNYFAPVKNRQGQTEENQIDCLALIGSCFNNSSNRLWEMRNGYALATESGLREIEGILNNSTEEEMDKIRQLLRIGIQWRTSVTLEGSHHKVTQAYCSALPVAYSSHPSKMWSAFARLILEASYEATICTALLNYRDTGNKKVFLTLVGGGVFGNEMDWILKAIKRAVSLYKQYDLEVLIVSYGSSNPSVKKMIKEILL